MKPKQQAGSIAELYSHAFQVQERYNQFTALLAQKCGGVTPVVLKHPLRVIEKAALSQDSSQRGRTDLSLDIVRGGLMFNELNTSLQALLLLASCDAHERERIQAEEKVQAATIGITEQIIIHRVKDRMRQPVAVDGVTQWCAFIRRRPECTHL